MHFSWNSKSTNYRRRECWVKLNINGFQGVRHVVTFFSAWTDWHWIDEKVISKWLDRIPRFIDTRTQIHYEIITCISKDPTEINCFGTCSQKNWTTRISIRHKLIGNRMEIVKNFSCTHSFSILLILKQSFDNYQFSVYFLWDK